MAKLKYVVGGERSEVIEHENFASSIFSDQYSHALKAIDRYLEVDIKDVNSRKSSFDDTLRVVAFSGERGDGKSSCMRTVMWMINNLDDIRNFKVDDRKFIENLNVEALRSNTFKILPVIDPAFFDNKHNVLEFIIGQIYSEVKSKGDDVDRYLRKKLMEDFQKIKAAIIELSDRPTSGYDEISELSTLASAMTLRTLMEEMMEHYLKFIDRSKLIIAIDDIDLNMGKAYEMCEQLRKYLGNRHCVVLISVKLPQLHTAISAHMKNECGNMRDPEIFQMASKYIDKLLPSAIRISMPNMYGLSEIPVSISQKGMEYPIYENEKLKEGIVELIFQRTRYLFYNSLGGVSPIVPSNLRDLTMLLGLLVSMYDISPNHSSERETSKLNSNKLLFKEYFYREWTQRLTGENRTEIEKWLKPENRVAQNKLISQYLRKFKASGRDYSVWEEDEPGYSKTTDYFEKITDDSNFSYNVSLGDVFHIISLLEQDRLDAEQETMLFFIKSHYSIMLYEAYDIITEDLSRLYPEAESDEGILYRFDERFAHVNELQRMVGNYFSYEPNELLPTDSDSGSSYDIRKLDLDTDTKNLKDSVWSEILNAAWDGLKKLVYFSESVAVKERDEILESVRIAEFFMLTVSRNIPSKEIRYNPLVSDFRRNVRPAYVQYLYSPMKYFLFDALMPFAAMTNLPFAYNRFYKLYIKEDPFFFNEDFFSLALQTKGTLLRDMIEVAWENRHDDCLPDDFDKKLNNLEDGYTEYLHNLLSDAVIRNGEVLAAIFSNLKSRRYEVRDAKDLEKIIKMYEFIQESGMATHRVSKNSDPYSLTFAFLTPIMDFLDEIKENEDFQRIFKDADSQKFLSQKKWSDPDYDVLLKYTSEIWNNTGKKSVNKTLTKRTLIRYFTGRFDWTDSEFRKILNDFEKRNGIEDNINHPYSLTEFTDAMYEAKAAIPEEEVERLKTDD